MPRRDGSGPDGRGPKTGRQLGNCDGAKTPKPNGRDKGKGLGGWKIIDNKK